MNQALYGDKPMTPVSTPVLPKLSGIDDTGIFVDGLMKLARKKGGRAEIVNRLTSLNSMAQYEGEQRREEQSVAQLKAVTAAMDEKIVCGFIAEIDIAMKQYRGLPPDLVWNVNSLTIVKIVDALNRAGYTPQGRVNGADREEKRQAVMERVRGGMQGNVLGGGLAGARV